MAKNILLRSFLWLLFPFFGFIILSYLTYPLQPHCELGNGLFGCVPVCTPEVMAKLQRDFPFGGSCFHGGPVAWQSFFYQNKLVVFLLELAFLIAFFIWAQRREKAKQVLRWLAELPIKPLVLFRENRKNKNLLSRLISLILIVILIPLWVIGDTIVIVFIVKGLANL